MNVFTSNRKTSGRRAQAMVEFAIVAPILFLMLFGLLEVGRMVFVYAAVNNASREAVRYGSVVGYDPNTGMIRYKDCAAITALARNASYLTNTTVEIRYDHGPGTTPTGLCTTVYSGYLTSGDRIMVKISAQYKPYTKLIPWGPRWFSSTSYRTILGYVAVGTPSPYGGSGPGGGSASHTPTATLTATIGPSSTPTDTPTITPTFSGDLFTFTPIATGTETATPSTTPTDTPTLTPTATATVVPGCDQITGGPIYITSNYMAMKITNPHTDVTVSSVHLVWNTAHGAPSQNALTLRSGSLGSLFWLGSDTSGNISLTAADFSQEVTIPGNNATSTIFFTFDDFYDNPDGTESISITLSTPGCENITIQSIPPTPKP